MFRTLLASIIVSVFVVPSYAIADWDVRTETDPITDKVEKQAYVKNDSGYKFAIYRNNADQGMALFSLPETFPESIDPERPMYVRIDKNEPQKYGRSNNVAGLKLFHWNPGFVNIRVWHGNEQEGLGTLITQLMEGSDMVVRYPVSTGGNRDVFFTLDGSANAIQKALDIDMQAAQSESAMKSERYKDLIVEFSNWCLNTYSGSQMVQCNEVQLECSESYPQPNIEGLRDCLKEEEPAF